MFVEGGASSKRAEVNTLNQLETMAMRVSRTGWMTLREGVVWTVPFDAIDPTGADDYFLFIRNDGAEPLAITKLSVSSTVAGIVELQGVTGDPSGGTAVAVVNRQVGNNKTPDTTIESGVNITGLTDAGVLEFIRLVANTQQDTLLQDDPIVLVQNQEVALLWTGATGILTGNVTLELMKKLS
jgi:hypothetical protein